jgi:hypothetical protein
MLLARAVAAITRSTSSGGKVWVSTPIAIRSGRRSMPLAWSGRLLASACGHLRAPDPTWCATRWLCCRQHAYGAKNVGPSRPAASTPQAQRGCQGLLHSGRRHPIRKESSLHASIIDMTLRLPVDDMLFESSAHTSCPEPHNTRGSAASSTSWPSKGGRSASCGTSSQRTWTASPSWSAPGFKTTSRHAWQDRRPPCAAAWSSI